MLRMCIHRTMQTSFWIEINHSRKSLKRFASAGFKRDGKSRIFVHSDSSFTIDFPRGPLAVGGDYVRETAVLQNGEMMLRILTPTDCVRDRLAHFYHWEDFTALNAAVGVARAKKEDIDMSLLRSWSEREDSLGKFAEFERRLDAANR